MTEREFLAACGRIVLTADILRLPVPNSTKLVIALLRQAPGVPTAQIARILHIGLRTAQMSLNDIRAQQLEAA